MAAPLFFSQVLSEGAPPSVDNVVLDEATSRHIARVLRMEPGDGLRLTNGEGLEAQCVIEEVGKRDVRVRIHRRVVHAQPQPRLHLAVAFTRNPSRNEWLLEKTTELGVAVIIPILAARSERERVKPERWRTILQSAMLQSGQFYMPQLVGAAPLAEVFARCVGIPHKYIAHCEAGERKMALGTALGAGQEVLILIGPEGDFTPNEIALAKSHGCAPVSLGTTRLRAETAAVAAAALFHLINDETA